MKKIVWALLCTLGLHAGEFEHAMEAYKAGSYIEALNGFFILAKNGDAKAQYNVALMYAKGQGAQPDIKKAMEWYEKAAKQGLALAQYNLAQLYQSLGEKEDHAYEKAKYWYEKAAEQGIMQAYNNLGSLYLEGKGVPKDIHKAHALFKKAAQMGDTNADLNVALLHAWGEGMPTDKMKAYEHFTKALRAGRKEAQPYLERLCKESPWACQKQ